jgi:hypothetical protein
MNNYSSQRAIKWKKGARHWKIHGVVKLIFVPLHAEFLINRYSDIFHELW